MRLPAHFLPSGRGSPANPANRFDGISTELDPEALAEDPPRRTPTQFIEDSTCSILSRNSSPDIPFDVSLNPYRGCEHGCAYCYARPTHEYLGYSAGLDFETRVIVKPDAPKLLEWELSHPQWKPKVVAMSGVTDPYQPVEKRLRITRGCLEVLARFRNPVGVISKNALIARDADILADMATWNGAVATVSITTLDADLARRMEPRTSSPRQRLEAVRTLARAGVPVGVNVAPIIPGLNDNGMPEVIAAAAEAGASRIGVIPLRLPYGVKEIFLDWLDRSEPGKKGRVISRIRSIRGGKLNDPRFGHRFRGEGIWAEQIQQMRELGMRRAGLVEKRTELSTEHFRPLGGRQLGLGLE